MQEMHNGLDKPNLLNKDPKLVGLSKSRLQKRRQWIENGVKWGMHPSQIERYTEIMGDRVSERQVRNYITEIKPTKKQRYRIENQGHHENMVFEAFLKIGSQLALSGYPPEVIQFDSSPGLGAGFRYDFKFKANGYLFYGEVQLSDLAGTNWRKKHRQYVKFRKESDTPFRVLWVIDQKRDMGLVRYNAKKALEGTKYNIFFYIPLLQLVNLQNIITTPVWFDVNGKNCTFISL
jgi:hypothetical protein